MMKQSGSKEKRHKSKARDSKKAKPHDKSPPIGCEKSPPKDAKDEELKVTELDEAVPSELPECCKPLSRFLHDREEMIEQVFSSVRDTDLHQMIPKPLKCYNMDQLKKMCLRELKGMCDGEVLHIIQGKDPESFSKGTATVNVGPAEDRKITEDGPHPALKRKHKDDEGSTSPEIETPAKGAADEVAAGGRSFSPEKGESTSNEAFLELYPSTREMEKMAGVYKKEPLELNEDSDLELLELEMRARAIRSLLRARGLPSSEDEDESGAKL